MRILLVSQMYPGPRDPDLGVFVRDLELALAARGHEIRRAVLDRRAGGKLRHLELARAARREARAFRPDVVHAHFLVPAGLSAALATTAPLVVTAHGRDVRNAGAVPGVAAATRFVVRRAAAVIAVSEYLRRELELRVPEAAGKTHVVSSGVDLERFPLLPDAGNEEPSILCVGSLTERKNVVRLAGAFARLGRGTLTYVGEGPLRAGLERRPGVVLTGALPHAALVEHYARADVVAQPSLLEPLGQALLEAMACGRSVVATRIGGPPEFVRAGAGVLVDPLDEEAIARALETALALPRPNEAARAAAAGHDVRRQAERVEAILAAATRA
jgi:glycosyltransferase involved in cell wall biosynthesis